MISPAASRRCLPTLPGSCRPAGASQIPLAGLRPYRFFLWPPRLAPTVINNVTPHCTLSGCGQVQVKIITDWVRAKQKLFFIHSASNPYYFGIFDYPYIIYGFSPVVIHGAAERFLSRNWYFNPLVVEPILSMAPSE